MNTFTESILDGSLQTADKAVLDEKFMDISTNMTHAHFESHTDLMGKKLNVGDWVIIPTDNNWLLGIIKKFTGGNRAMIYYSHPWYSGNKMETSTERCWKFILVEDHDELIRKYRLDKSANKWYNT